MSRAPMGSALAAALKACRRHLVAAAGFSALVNILYIVPTLYMLQVYDRVVPTHGLVTLVFLTLVLLFALATLSLLDRFRARLLVRAGVQLDAALAAPILDAALSRPEQPVARQALREFDTMRGAFTGAGILSLFDAPWIPIYILICFMVHTWIGVVAVIGCLILPLIAWANERATRPRLDAAQTVAGQSYSALESMLASAESVRALGMRRAMVARQLRQRETMLMAQTEASFASGGYLTAGKFARLALQSLALGLGALLAVDGLISPGAIFASSFLIARALAPIEQLIGTSKTIVQARQSYHNLERLLQDKATDAAPTQLPAPAGAIALEGVTVMGDGGDRVIVNGVSLKIAAGEVIAILGPSGAGKSTLIRTIAGALRPDRGTIRFDGAEMRDWDPERLARSIGYLPQDSALLAGTVSENISRFAGELGEDRAAVDAAVVTAAARVSADGLIRRLANGYDHMLRLGGLGVSAGQAQRIALARAVYGDPRILILDEPNAHLDTEGDAALVDALGALKREGRTILIVSHKLGVLPVVDRIVFMREGRVELDGPRNEVLQKIMPPNMRRVIPATAKGNA